MALTANGAHRVFAVRQAGGGIHRGTFEFGAGTFVCALGRSGIARLKREGDGATPAGVWPIRCLYYRPDRLPRPRTTLPCFALHPDEGWCDDPTSAFYNRPVNLPFSASAERMWREDQLYDLVAVLAYNDLPAVPGRGSCIFLHVAAPDYSATEGCVALERRDLLLFLSACGAGAALRIG